MPEWREEIRRRLAGLALPPTRAAEIVEELSQHLDDRYRELLRGSTPTAAAQAVLQELSDGELLAQALAGVERPLTPDPVPLGASGGSHWLARLGQDIRFGVRMLRMRLGFTLVAALTLALGIGATTAIFSVVHSVLLRSLPYPESDRLVKFWGTAPEKRLPMVAYPDAMFVFFRERNRSFEAISSAGNVGVNLNTDGEPQRLNAAAVMPDFFTVMGVPPAYGRGFVAEDHAAGRPQQVVVLGDALWRQRFDADPAIVGKTITINGQPLVVTGIMPPGFDYPNQSDIWLPNRLNPEGLSNWRLIALARLKPGVQGDVARREIAALADQFMRARPARFSDYKPRSARVVLKSLQADLVGDFRTPLLVLMGSVALVLLIAAANIANLMLARAAARTREMAVRCCLGAGPRRIAAQLFTESLLLALAGGAGGVGLALWGVAALRRIPLDLPGREQIQLDPAVLGFSLGITVLTALIFGLAPALRAARVDLQDGLREGSRSSSSATSRRLTRAFVVAQFALSLVLLVGAGLLVRSFRHLLAVNPGFRAEQVLTARIQLPASSYNSAAKISQFYDQLLAGVRGAPGVIAAGINEQIPFTPGSRGQELYVEGQEPRAGEDVPVISTRSVSPGYFQAMGTPLLQGRDFQSGDIQGSLPVVIIDATVAQRYWPGGGALGKRIRTSTDSDAAWFTVVGVVPNVKQQSLGEEPDFQLYQPFDQFQHWGAYVVVRTTAAPDAFAALVKQRVRELDPTLPVAELRTLQAGVDASLLTRRLTNALLGGFALLALLLAALGIYGVMSLSVAGRLGEFGVRLALGAAPGDVLRLVVRQGLGLAAVGVLLGLLGALGVTRLLRTLLFETSPFDPLTFGGVAAALAAVAILACYLPARRATRADPIAVLRRE